MHLYIIKKNRDFLQCQAQIKVSTNAVSILSGVATFVSDSVFHILLLEAFILKAFQKQDEFLLIKSQGT